ncbi:polynucleotide adenylyltransferase family protein [Citrus sinensis]|nr:polynucleotide adenylyltransferase family protein [Citrus sinensis]
MPAKFSFEEDCSHKLCGARDAARLGFHLSSDIALSLKQLSRSVMILDKRRIVMELNHMLAFGSAEASFRLLWRFGLLKILIPVQASYFDLQGLQRSNMLLKLFANLDRLVTPKWPCDECICFAGFCVLAFHKALVDQSRDPFVVSAFGYAVHGHGNLDEAVKSLILQHQSMMQLRKMMDDCYVSRAMIEFSEATFSDLVFIPPETLQQVYEIFECIRRGMESGFVIDQDREIDYEPLAQGCLQEVRHVFGRIVFDTVYPPNKN